MKNAIRLIKTSFLSYFDTIKPLLKTLLKILGLLGITSLLVACGSFYQDNLYGNGHYVSKEEREANQATPPDPTDYQAYQYNFVSISVNRVSYKLTQTLSQISLEGSCFNPGFQYHSIYFNAVDASGAHLASDGLAYSTNIRYYPGTSRLQQSNIQCSSSGNWSTAINVPTSILYKLAQGFIDVSMVVWYKGDEYHNDKTGVASVSINPPPMEDPYSVDEQISTFQ